MSQSAGGTGSIRMSQRATSQSGVSTFMSTFPQQLKYYENRIDFYGELGNAHKLGNHKLVRHHKFCFDHKYGMVNIRKGPPKRGIHHNLPNDIPYIQGNSLSNHKLVHAKYCDGLFPSKIYDDGSIKHYRRNWEESLDSIAFDESKGYFFLSEIMTEFKNDFTDVRFDYGRVQNQTSILDIIKIPERRLNLKLKNYVMANVINEFGENCWVPGQIIDIYYDRKLPKLFRILYFNGEEDDNMTYQLIKIDENLYFYIVDRILRYWAAIKKKESPPPVKVDNYKSILQMSNESSKTALETLSTSLSAQLSEMRQSKLRVDSEILAKWPNDGWYYESRVLESLGDGKFKLANKFKDVKEVFREDIMFKSNTGKFDIGDTVVALHPYFEFGAYAPGEIVKILTNPDDDIKFVIRFYDFSENAVEKKNVYKLDKARFQYDINTIITIEKSWIGHTVLAFNNRTDCYEWGVIVNRVGQNRQFVVQWPSGENYIQNAYHIFVSVNRKFDPANKVETETKAIVKNSKTRSSAGSTTGSLSLRSNTFGDRFSIKDDNMKTPFDGTQSGVGFFREIGYTYDERDDDYQQKNDLFKFSLIDPGRETPVIDAREYNSGYGIGKISIQSGGYRSIEKKSQLINASELHNGPKQKYVDTYY